jgi:hypothetical protein
LPSKLGRRLRTPVSPRDLPFCLPSSRASTPLFSQCRITKPLGISRPSLPNPKYSIPSYPLHSNSNPLPIVHPPANHLSAFIGHLRLPLPPPNLTFISISPPSSLNTPHSSFLPQLSLTPHFISLSTSLLQFLSFPLGSKQEKSPDNPLARD